MPQVDSILVLYLPLTKALFLDTIVASQHSMAMKPTDLCNIPRFWNALKLDPSTSRLAWLIQIQHCNTYVLVSTYSVMIISLNLHAWNLTTGFILYHFPELLIWLFILIRC